ncbi:MAG: hypothetical protein M1827_005175 [Pycnora praestabilis]|nr:MAG: hypothetical protein M1827_005175 [Pycnora praestabilis]
MFFSITLPILAALLSSVFADPYYDYAIYPVDGTDDGKSAIIQRDLESILAGDNIFLSESATLGRFFWWATLTETEASDFQNSHQDEVATVSQACYACMNYERVVNKDVTSRSIIKKRGIDLQKNADDDLKVISQPKDTPNIDDLPGYYYDSTAGQNTRVYIIDSGASNNFQFTGKQIDWIWAGPAPDTGKKDDTSGHGTCMLSKVIGSGVGVAKNAKSTMVSIADYNGNTNIESIIDALVKVYDDIALNGYGGQAVVSMSLVFHPKNFPGTDPEPDYTIAWKAAMIKMINALISVGAVLVAAAGNEGGEVTGFPAAFGATIPGLIVVGGVDNLGNQWGMGQTAAFVKVSAPAVDVSCADADDDQDLIVQTGTSLATAMVAGLVATFLTTGTTVSQVQQHLYDLAYDRYDGGPDVVYNGLGNPAGVAATTLVTIPPAATTVMPQTTANAYPPANTVPASTGAPVSFSVPS